jgi:cell division control protein 6
LAGETAESSGDEAIRETHVEDARQQLDAERVEEGMRELTVHGKLVLLAVVSKTANRLTPCRGRDVYDEYRRLCVKAKTDPLVRRSVNNHLSDLRMFGILEARENRSGSRGNYYSYELNVPFQSALEAMSDALGLGTEVARIREQAKQNRLL